MSRQRRPTDSWLPAFVHGSKSDDRPPPAPRPRRARPAGTRGHAGRLVRLVGQRLDTRRGRYQNTSPWCQAAGLSPRPSAPVPTPPTSPPSPPSASCRSSRRHGWDKPGPLRRRQAGQRIIPACSHSGGTRKATTTERRGTARLTMTVAALWKRRPVPPPPPRSKPWPPSSERSRPMPRSDPTLDAAWEALAEDIHFTTQHGLSRDGVDGIVMGHRPLIEGAIRVLADHPPATEGCPDCRESASGVCTMHNGSFALAVAPRAATRRSRWTWRDYRRMCGDSTAGT